MKCSDECDRPPCDEPCRRVLRCGHPCIGLCGEKCPRLCRVCNRKELTEFILYGFEEDDDARFIELTDCHHCIEVQALDHWMRMENEHDQNDTNDEILMKCCPRCKVTIWRSFRYGNVIRRRTADVQKVKKRLFGKEKFLRKKMFDTLNVLLNNPDIKIHFREEYSALTKRLGGKQQVHQNEMVVIENQVNLLKGMMSLKNKAAKNLKSSSAKAFFDKEVKFLTNRLMSNKENVNAWELEAINQELNRSYLTALYKDTVEELQNYPNVDNQRYLSTVRTLLGCTLPLTKVQEKEIEECIEKATVRKGLGISERERVEIVKAIGLGTGHWYKCPNGHVYCIADCGGANQGGRCNECGSAIGGQNHSLAPGNAHAGEMDGSRHAAWSNLTGLGNYDLQDLH